MLTEIKVIYADGVKAPEEYAPPKKAEVHLTAVVPEGADADALLDKIGETAVAQANKMLGKTAEPAKRTRAKAADKAPTTAAETTQAAEIGSAVVVENTTAAKDAQKRAYADVMSNVDTTATKAADPAEISFDIPADPVKAETPAEITDAELNSRVQKKNAEINNPVAIRNLIATYKTDPAKPFQLREIPQAKRAEFLAKLDALAAA